MTDKYDNMYVCIKCSGSNDVKTVTTDGGYTSEAETYCMDCGHKDYWAYGFFNSDPPDNPNEVTKS